MLQELTSLLQAHMADNKQMTSTVAHLTDERRSLQNRVKELEDRLNIKPPYDDPVSRVRIVFLFVFYQTNLYVVCRLTIYSDDI